MTRRGRGLLPAIGGGLVAMMGALVIYEYATGKSLGIDTFFFYPWLRTLSANPGRMAPDIGNQLCELRCSAGPDFFSSKAVGTFAIFHSVPASLGLTSAMGYLAGVTFVLPFHLGSQMAVHTALAFLVYGCDDSETLLKNAGAALSRVKGQGGNGYQFYASDMNATALHQLALENGMRRALEREEFMLYYQPQVEIGSNRILAVEALIRWQHPELGFISPADFIPLAESNGLILPIGEWTLRTACGQARHWHKQGMPMRMSVNLSARQFEQPDLLEMIARVLKETRFDPSYLEFEITESAVMKNADRAIEIMDQLKQMQIQIAIDDFGSGYSSLSHLKRFPIDRLKIDQSFVREAVANSTDAAIIMAIVSLAQNLRLKVIAEGVETEEQLRLLRLLRCDEIQGYLFSKPLPPVELDHLLQKQPQLPHGLVPSLQGRMENLAVPG